MKPGEEFYAEFVVPGIDPNEERFPSALMVRNGLEDSKVQVVVARNAGGIYAVLGRVPATYLGGDALQINVSFQAWKGAALATVLESEKKTMSYRPGDTIWEEFTTQQFDTGSAADAKALPSATLVRNGADTGITLTVAKVDTGRYTVTGAIPETYAGGDKVQIAVAATVTNSGGGDVAGKSIIASFVLGERSGLFA